MVIDELEKMFKPPLDKLDIMLDKLDTMFEMQYGLQERLGTNVKIREDMSNWQQFVNQMILACQEELIEIMRETAYKNPNYVPFGWKQNQEINKDKMKEEIVDLFHFFINLCHASGMDSSELFERYVSKNCENHIRQNEGY